MRSLVVARREWSAAFGTPAGWVVVAGLPAAAAAFFFLLGPFFAIGEASLRNFFALMPWLLAVIAPALTMRLWAEERRSGTEELLLTYPMRLRDVVLGKFLGAWAQLALALACTALVPATVAALGDLDPGPVIAGYLGTLLLGGAYLAVGLFLSACTRNQVVAWLAAAAVLVAANLLGVAATAEAMPPGVGRVLLAADLGHRFREIARGVVDARVVFHYLGVTVYFLCVNGLVLERRRWTS